MTIETRVDVTVCWGKVWRPVCARQVSAISATRSARRTSIFIAELRTVLLQRRGPATFNLNVLSNWRMSRGGLKYGAPYVARVCTQPLHSLSEADFPRLESGLRVFVCRGTHNTFLGLYNVAWCIRVRAREPRAISERSHAVCCANLVANTIAVPAFAPSSDVLIGLRSKWQVKYRAKSLHDVVFN